MFLDSRAAPSNCTDRTRPCPQCLGASAPSFLPPKQCHHAFQPLQPGEVVNTTALPPPPPPACDPRPHQEPASACKVKKSTGLALNSQVGPAI
jgi:hypothetical protein